jgi:hypothetical protein
MKLKFILFMVCLTCCGLFGCRMTADRTKPKVEEVSLVQVLASPQKFDGRDIMVTGYYLSKGNENSTLYLSRDDARIGNISSGIAIAGYQNGRVITSEAFNKRQSCFLAVSGKFRAGPTGHMGLWPGMIESVTGVSVFDEKAEKWIEEETKEGAGLKNTGNQ